MTTTPTTPTDLDLWQVKPSLAVAAFWTAGLVMSATHLVLHMAVAVLVYLASGPEAAAICLLAVLALSTAYTVMRWLRSEQPPVADTFRHQFRGAPKWALRANYPTQLLANGIPALITAGALLNGDLGVISTVGLLGLTHFVLFVALRGPVKHAMTVWK